MLSHKMQTLKQILFIAIKLISWFGNFVGFSSNFLHCMKLVANNRTHPYCLRLKGGDGDKWVKGLMSFRTVPLCRLLLCLCVWVWLLCKCLTCLQYLAGVQWPKCIAVKMTKTGPKSWWHFRSSAHHQLIKSVSVNFSLASGSLHVALSPFLK